MAKTRKPSKLRRTPEGRLLDDLIGLHADLLAEHATITTLAAQRAVDEATARVVEEVRRRLPAGGLAEIKTRRDLAPIRETWAETRAAGLDEVERVALTAAQQAAIRRSADIVRASAVSAAAGDLAVTFGTLGTDQLREAARRTFLSGDEARWIREAKVKGVREINRQLRLAYSLGEGIPAIVRRVKKAGVADAVLAETVARTSVQAASGRAALATYQANSEAISGLVVVATLDSATCPICGPLDGRRLSLTQPAFAIPFHPRCRCFLAPQPRGLAPLVIPSWSEWIVDQDAARQDRILGPGRARLLRSGVLAPNDFITRDGELRTVARLRALAAGRK